MASLPERASAYLAGDGHRVVHRHLRAHGLPVTFADDLVQETLVRCVTASARGVEPDTLEAFVSELVRRSARDLLRGLRRRPEGHLATHEPGPEDLIGEGDDPVDVVLDQADLDALGSRVDGVRRRLTARLADHPIRAAGGLAVLAIAHGEAEPAIDCPAPAGGVDAAEAVTWAGLFYSGAPRCFPTADDPEDAAMRQRRSRGLRHLRATLAVAAADLGAVVGRTDD